MYNQHLYGNLLCIFCHLFLHLLLKLSTELCNRQHLLLDPLVCFDRVGLQYPCPLHLCWTHHQLHQWVICCMGSSSSSFLCRGRALERDGNVGRGRRRAPFWRSLGLDDENVEQPLGVPCGSVAKVLVRMTSWVVPTKDPVQPLGIP